MQRAVELAIASQSRKYLVTKLSDYLYSILQFLLIRVASTLSFHCPVVRVVSTPTQFCFRTIRVVRHSEWWVAIQFHLLSARSEWSGVLSPRPLLILQLPKPDPASVTTLSCAVGRVWRFGDWQLRRYYLNP